MNKEIVYENAYILTMNKKNDIFFGDVIIKDGKIERIIEKNVSGPVNKIIMPSFCNLHVHLGETIFRGRCDGMTLFEYLDVSHDSYKNEEWMRLEEQIHHLSGMITLMELIKEGCGTVVCSRGWEEVERCGIRGYCLFPIVDIDKLKNYYNDVDFLKQMQVGTNNNNVNNSIFIQSIYLSAEEKFDYVAECMAQNPELKLFIHVAETKREQDYVKQKYGCTPIEFLHRKGLLNDRVFCVHCIYLSDHDIQLIRLSGANVILCPISNLKLKDGYPLVEKMLENNIRLIVGTDGFATNNSASLLEELKLIGIMSSGHIDENELLKMITTNPAEALYHEGDGQIAEGNVANINVFEIPSYLTIDKKRIANNLIYNFTSVKCTNLISNGKEIYKGGEFSSIMEDDVVFEYSLLLKKLFRGEQWEIY